MSVEQTRATMTAYLQVLVERGPYADYFADDVTFTLMGSDQQVQGRDAVEQFIRYLHEQAFDARPEVKAVIVSDDQAVLEAEFIGEHINDFMGVPASKLSVRVPYAVVYDLRDDKLTALRAYLPMDVLMRQISSVSSTASVET
jgi:steroid delta-isomerase-like uncharacterized protein